MENSMGTIKDCVISVGLLACAACFFISIVIMIVYSCKTVDCKVTNIDDIKYNPFNNKYEFGIEYYIIAYNECNGTKTYEYDYYNEIKAKKKYDELIESDIVNCYYYPILGERGPCQGMINSSDYETFKAGVIMLILSSCLIFLIIIDCLCDRYGIYDNIWNKICRIYDNIWNKMDKEKNYNVETPNDD